MESGAIWVVLGPQTLGQWVLLALGRTMGSLLALGQTMGSLLALGRTMDSLSWGLGTHYPRFETDCPWVRYNIVRLAI